MIYRALNICDCIIGTLFLVLWGLGFIIVNKTVSLCKTCVVQCHYWLTKMSQCIRKLCCCCNARKKDTNQLTCCICKYMCFNLNHCITENLVKRHYRSFYKKIYRFQAIFQIAKMFEMGSLLSSSSAF